MCSIQFVSVQNNKNQLIFPIEVHSGAELYRYLNFILILFFKIYILWDDTININCTY